MARFFLSSLFAITGFRCVVLRLWAVKSKNRIAGLTLKQMVNGDTIYIGKKLP